MFDSKDKDRTSPPGLVIVSVYDKLAFKPSFPIIEDKEIPPPLILTSSLVPFIPFKVGRAIPNKVKFSPKPKAEFADKERIPSCLANSSL